MKQYIVGGAVRDVLLGRPISDVDYVWVGATPDAMLAKGFSQVGNSFPVFLDSNGDQHALARTERKTGVGYNGFDVEFDPTVTLADDLFRRDFTINAMAVAIEHWDQFTVTGSTEFVVDPYNGLADLSAGILRAVSSHFLEDPVRVLRAARFAARYQFRVDPDTVELMNVAAAELDHVPYDRIWAELEKSVGESSAPVYFSVLASGISRNQSKHMKPLLDATASLAHAIPRAADLPPIAKLHKLAFVARNFDKQMFQKYRVPAAVRKVAEQIESSYHVICWYKSTSCKDKLDLFYRLHAFNDQKLLDDVVCALDAYHCAGWAYVIMPRPLDSYATIRMDLSRIIGGVDVESIAAMSPKHEIAASIYQARLEALQSV